MKLRDKVWTLFFLLTGAIFTATIIYEFFYIHRSYTKLESERMERVYAHYEKELEAYLKRKTEEAKTTYMLRGNPIVNKLNNQDTYIVIEGENRGWRKEEWEAHKLLKDTGGYAVAEGMIFGYAQELNGTSYVFRLHPEELQPLKGMEYYQVFIGPAAENNPQREGILFGNDYVEKSFYRSALGGNIMIQLRREGAIFNSILSRGRRIFIWGGGILALLTLLGARMFEKSISYPIKRAAQKLEGVIVNGEYREKISLGEIDELKELERGLNEIIKSFRERRHKYKLLYEELPVFTAILDINLNLIEVNDYFSENLLQKGRDDEDNLLSYIPNEKVNLFTSLYRKLESTDKISNEGFHLIDSDLNLRHVEISMKKSVMEGGREVIFFSALDTEYINRRNNLKEAEKYDRFIEIYNSEYGNRYLDKYINMCKISNFTFTAVLVWPKNLKEINERYEGQERVKISKIVARSIKEVLRGTDLIYRFDRNSFALLLPMARMKQVKGIMDRAEEKLAEIEREDGLKDLGIDYVVSGYDGGVSGAVFREALAEKSFNKRNELGTTGIIKENRIVEAMERGEFQVEYEPVFDPGEGRLSFDALLVWDSCVAGRMHQEEFMPAVLEKGIGDRVLEYTLKRIAEDMGEIGTKISLRIPGEEFERGEVAAMIRKVFIEREKRGRLMLKVPEEVLVRLSDDGKSLAREIKSMGIGFILDDFGRGKASVHHMRYFDFERLDIDRNLLEGMNNSITEGQVKSMLGIGRGLGRTVLAKGAESIEEIRRLRGMGFTSFQGGAVGKPLSPKEAGERIKNSEYEKELVEVMS